MEISDIKTFFLGATTAEGFVSYFADCYSAREGYKCYILKGGPGTGKSSLMKKIAKTAAERGEEFEICICSTDPKSLDAVILPKRRIVVLDGTAPHIVEPNFPGICEELVNLGQGFKNEMFEGKAGEILELNSKCALCHRAAQRYLAAAGKLLSDARRCAVDCVHIDKAAAYAMSLSNKLFGRKAHKTEGKVNMRFLSAPTSLGRLFIKSTPEISCDKMIVFEDEYRAYAPAVLDIIKRQALKAGYDVTVCTNPYFPGSLIDHLLIPELKLALCTKDSVTSPAAENMRTVHSRRFTDISSLRVYRSRLKFDRRAGAEMISAACDSILKAKQTHDELEKIYINAMDFSKVNVLCDELINKIFR